MKKSVWELLDYKPRETTLQIMTIVGGDDVEMLTKAYAELMRFLLVFQLYLEQIDDNYALLRAEYGDDEEEFAKAKRDCDQFVAKFDERFAKRIRLFRENEAVEYVFPTDSGSKVVQFPLVTEEIRCAAVEIVKTTAVYGLITRK